MAMHEEAQILLTTRFHLICLNRPNNALVESVCY